MDFIGKNAIITGGCGSIGKHLAMELLRNGVQGIGLFDVVDNPSETINFLKNDLPNRAVKFYKTNVRDKCNIIESFKMFKNDFEHIDIVIACAGIVNEFEIEKVIELNLIGAINTMLIGMDEMSLSKGGCGGLIVAVSSTNATKFLPYVPCYAATKHGMLAFTTSMGNDVNLKKHGVRFITICPGRTESILIQKENFKNMYLPDFLILANNLKKSQSKNQTAETVAKLSMKPMASGETGSVWIIDEDKYKKYVPPTIENF